jgi:hypothetical protein
LKIIDDKTLAIVAIVAALGLLGLVGIDSISMQQQQQAFAAGCPITSVAANASKTRCVH